MRGLYVRVMVVRVHKTLTLRRRAFGSIRRPSTWVLAPPVGFFDLGTTGICVTKLRGRLLRLVDLQPQTKNSPGNEKKVPS